MRRRSGGDPLLAFAEYHEQTSLKSSKKGSRIVCAYGFEESRDLLARMPDYKSKIANACLNIYLRSGRQHPDFGSSQGRAYLCIVCQPGHDPKNLADPGHAYACFIEGELRNEDVEGNLSKDLIPCATQYVTCTSPFTNVHIFHVCGGPNVGEYAIEYKSYSREVKRFRVFFVTTVDPFLIREAQMYALLACPLEYVEFRTDCFEYAKTFVWIYNDFQDPQNIGLLINDIERVDLEALTLNDLVSQTTINKPALQPFTVSWLGGNDPSDLFIWSSMGRHDWTFIILAFFMFLVVIFAMVSGAVVYFLMQK